MVRFLHASNVYIFDAALSHETEKVAIGVHFETILIMFVNNFIIGVGSPLKIFLLKVFCFKIKLPVFRIIYPANAIPSRGFFLDFLHFYFFRWFDSCPLTFFAVLLSLEKFLELSN